MKKNITLFLLGVLSVICVAALPTTLNLSQFNTAGPLGIKSGASVSNIINTGLLVNTNGDVRIYKTTNPTLFLTEFTSGLQYSVQGRSDAMRFILQGYGTPLSLFTNLNASFAGGVTNLGPITFGGETRTNWPSGSSIVTNYDHLFVTNNANIGGSVTIGTNLTAGGTVSAAGGSFGVNISGDVVANTINLGAGGTVINELGDITSTGKGTFSGGIDPPYILYDAHTPAETKARVLIEVPKEKQTGAALFFNPQSHRLEIYIASEDKFYDLNGNHLAAADAKEVAAHTAILKSAHAAKIKRSEIKK